MKKFLVITVILLTVFGLWTYSCSRQNIQYPPGKDTIKSFGDGTFQICHSINEILWCFKYQTCIIDKVEAVEEMGEKAYIVGSTIQGDCSDDAQKERIYHIYTILNTVDNTMQFCAVSSDATAPDIFIHRLKEMVVNGDAVIYAQLTDFSEVDQYIFKSMQQQETKESYPVTPDEDQ